MKSRAKSNRAVTLAPAPIGNNAGSDKAGSDKDRLRFWLRLLRTTRSIEVELRERLRIAFNTTMPRFDVMAALARRPEGMSMTALSRTLIVSNGNTTGIVDRLVADGLVMRMEHAKDKRATFVRLTREGERTFVSMASAHESWVRELLTPLDARTMSDISTHLDRLAPKPRRGDTT
jgi:DNA-binding MarR family transcriptional regulator